MNSPNPQFLDSFVPITYSICINVTWRVNCILSPLLIYWFHLLSTEVYVMIVLWFFKSVTKTVLIFGSQIQTISMIVFYKRGQQIKWKWRNKIIRASIMTKDTLRMIVLVERKWRTAFYWKSNFGSFLSKLSIGWQILTRESYDIISHG